MKKLSVYLICLLILFLTIGCDTDTKNPVSTSSIDVSTFLSVLPQKGSDTRFISDESIKQCQSDMEKIAEGLSITLKEERVRSILKEELKNKDAFWEISFNKLMSNKIFNGFTVFDLMVKNGVTNFTNLLKQYPDLRLSIPEKYENSFDPLSIFNIAILPVEDERYVKEIISFDFQGKKIILDPEILCDTPLLVLEIDENPDYHPMTIDDYIEVQIPQSQNPLNKLSKSTSVTKIRMYKEKLHHKLESVLSRAEFNVTVTLGDVVHTNDYSFPQVANRYFGITGVNKKDKWYSYKRYIWDYNPGNGFVAGKVLGICLWEDDPGGKSASHYYSADQIFSRPSGSTYNPGYLDTHGNCPDDLYGYVFIEYWDLYGAAGYNKRCIWL